MWAVCDVSVGFGVYVFGFSTQNHTDFSCHPFFWAGLQRLCSCEFSMSQEMFGHASLWHISCLAHWASVDQLVQMRLMDRAGGCRGEGLGALITQARSAGTPVPEAGLWKVAGGVTSLTLASPPWPEVGGPGQWV